MDHDTSVKHGTMLQYKYRTRVVYTAKIKCNNDWNNCALHKHIKDKHSNYIASSYLQLYSTQVICRLIHEQRDQGYFPRLNGATLISVPKSPEFTGLCIICALVTIL